MIEPMMKYAFLVYHKDYQRFLSEIRHIGVLHIIEKEQDVPAEISDQFEHIKEVGDLIKYLSKRKVEKTEAHDPISGPEAYEMAKKATGNLDQLLLQLNLVKKEIIYAAPWGNFSKHIIEQLRENGIKLKYFTCSAQSFEQAWLQEYPIEVISIQSGQVYFVLATESHDTLEFTGADEVKLPEKPLAELLQTKERLENEIKSSNDLIEKLASQNLEVLSNYHLNLVESVEYNKAVLHTVQEVDQKVMLLEGWVPAKKKDELEAYLESNSILFTSRRATPEDNVPVLLTNKKFSKKFEIIGGLYSLPKYGELDLTPFFAPFYTIFFGFCLGDAGYGLLIAITALVLRFRVPAELKQVMGLVFYLGLSTIVFGLIGGTFFGIPLYETSLPVYSTLAAKFEAQGTDINNILFQLSLGLGAIQILFGMVLKAINESRQYGWKLAVGTIGWITLLLGSIIVYSVGRFTPVEEATLRPVWYGLFGVSGVMILLLNDLTRNVFMNFGVGLWNTYNMVTGVIGDLLSYIRLFALGISSAILGFVFNSLAVSLSGDIPVVSAIVMVIILVVGHGINLFMAGLGSFVHPLRLTFVEFYKNAGFSGGGKKYSPFKKLT